MVFLKAHNRPIMEFKDILKQRHEESDMMWVSREFNWTKAYKHTKDIKNPSCLQGEVLKSSNILRLIEEEAKEKNTSQKEVKKTVENILEEIGCSKKLPVVRWLGYALLKVMKQTVSALYVNEDKLLKLREEMGSNPVLFMPSHRSYADFILMAFVMFNYGVDIPCVAAGMDFHSMWLMGRLLRDCSAFFMRRSFADDKVYRTVFEEYVKKLVSLGDAPVEFFIEGTRSRSAKSLMPKFGLLTMVMETFYAGEVPDITIVPVNISYDRTLEEVLFAYEMLGIAKPKESTSGLIKGLNMLDERYGNVYMDFCDPISVHQYVWEISNNDVNYVCRNLQREQQQIIHLAHQIVDSQQKNAVLSSFNVLALVLNNHLCTSDSPLMLTEASKDVSWLSSVLSLLGAYVRTEENSVKAVEESILVHKSLVKLSDDTIQLVNVHSPNSKIDPRRVKGHRLEESTMTSAVPKLMLQLYINPCLYFFVGPAIITVIMQQLGETESITRDDLFKKYQFLRAVLAHEFVLYKEWEDKEFQDTLLKSELINVTKSTSDHLLTLGNNRKLQLLLVNLLYPFLSGYLSLGRFLLQMKPETISEKDLTTSIQQRLEEDLNSGLIFSPYSLSLDLISCACSSLTQLNALLRLRKNGDVRYRVTHDKLMAIVNELEKLVIIPERLKDSVEANRKPTLIDPTTTRSKL